MMLLEAVDLFLAEYVTAPATHRAYSHCLLKMVRFLGEDRNLEAITPSLLKAHMDTLRVESAKYSDHPTRPTIQEPISLASWNKHLKSIKRFFNWLTEQEYLQISPARKIHKKKLPRDISRNKAMSDEELRFLLTAIWGDARTYAMVLFIADTGCRAAGVAGLQMQNLRLDERMALVVEKGEKARWVVFGEECERALRRWLKYRPTVTHNYVFTGCYEPFNGMKPFAVSQAIRRACVDIGIRSLGAHSLRHRKGHQLAAAGVAITTAADVLGHENTLITAGYYQETITRVREVGQQLAVTRANLRGEF